MFTSTKRVWKRKVHSFHSCPSLLTSFSLLLKFPSQCPTAARQPQKIFLRVVCGVQKYTQNCCCCPTTGHPPFKVFLLFYFRFFFRFRFCLHVLTTSLHCVHWGDIVGCCWRRRLTTNNPYCLSTVHHTSWYVCCVWCSGWTNTDRWGWTNKLGSFIFNFMRVFVPHARRLYTTHWSRFLKVWKKKKNEEKFQRRRRRRRKTGAMVREIK